MGPMHYSLPQKKVMADMAECINEAIMTFGRRAYGCPYSTNYMGQEPLGHTAVGMLIFQVLFVSFIYLLS